MKRVCELPEDAIRRSGTIRVPIHFDPEVFELLRKRAEYERTSIGEIVTAMVEGALW